MGTLTKYDLGKYIRDFKCDTFIETGTGEGTSLRYALKFPFEKYYSAEYYKVSYDKIKEIDIDNENVTIYNELSADMLKSLCAKELVGKVCFYWLDAHFPGSDTGHTQHGSSSSNEDIRLPLETELRTLVENRADIKYDTIMIDDVAIYEDLKHFVTPEDAKPKDPTKRNLNFVYELFSDTHDILKLSDVEQGYLIITPKEVKPEVKPVTRKASIKTVKKSTIKT